MTLAAMRSTDEDALICDFAETYHILDYRALPVHLQATLASGLRDNSRIKMKLMGFKMISTDLILARMADSIELFRYNMVAKEDTPSPTLLMDIMAGKAKKKEEFGFDSGADFEKAKAKFLAGVNHG